MINISHFYNKKQLKIGKDFFEEKGESYLLE